MLDDKVAADSEMSRDDVTKNRVWRFEVRKHGILDVVYPDVGVVVLVLLVTLRRPDRAFVPTPVQQQRTATNSNEQQQNVKSLMCCN